MKNIIAGVAVTLLMWSTVPHAQEPPTLCRNDAVGCERHSANRRRAHRPRLDEAFRLPRKPHSTPAAREAALGFARRGLISSRTPRSSTIRPTLRYEVRFHQQLQR